MVIWYHGYNIYIWININIWVYGLIIHIYIYILMGIWCMVIHPISWESSCIYIYKRNKGENNQTPLLISLVPRSYKRPLFAMGALEPRNVGRLLCTPDRMVKGNNSYLDYMLYLRLTLLAIGCDYCWSTVQYYLEGWSNSYSVE